MHPPLPHLARISARPPWGGLKPGAHRDMEWREVAGGHVVRPALECREGGGGHVWAACILISLISSLDRAPSRSDKKRDKGLRRAAARVCGRREARGGFSPPVFGHTGGGGISVLDRKNRWGGWENVGRVGFDRWEGGGTNNVQTPPLGVETRKSPVRCNGGKNILVVQH